MKQLQRNPIVESYLKDPDIHDIQRAGIVGAGVTLVVAFIAMLLHGLNAYFLFWREGSLVVFALVHVILSGVALLFAAGMYKIHRDARFMLLLGTTTAALGVFGAFGTLISILLHLWFMQVSQTFAEWFAMIFPRRKLTRPERIYEDLSYGRDQNPVAYSVVPFMDVMEVGSEAQKRKALARMSEYFEPQFSPAFRRALSDPSNTIRVQAATAVTRIENRFLEELMKIIELERRYPKDANIKLALAEHYDDYAFTGILDEEREMLNRTRALQHYREYLEMKPGDINVRIRAGRMMLRLGQNVEAAEWFGRCLTDGYSSDSLIIWYLESLFLAGRYAELRKNARLHRTRLRAYYDDLPQLAESVELWAGEKREPVMEAA